MLHPLHPRPAGAPTLPRALAIGVFDGVHRGHRSLLLQARALADAMAGEALAFTFAPHPAELLNPNLAPPMIEPLDIRLQRLAALGLDAAWVQDFNARFAALTPAMFVRDVLIGALRARHVVVGEGFTFGRRQSGSVATLRELGAANGFSVHAMPHVRVDGVDVSSTKIRAFVQAGQPAGAALLLGRDFALFGAVVHGAQRGRTLGFPTANVVPDNALRPAPGVYAGRCGIDAEPTRPAVINIGTAPTFGALPAARVEAHLLDYESPEFYGRRLSVALHARLRDEQRFAGPDALRRQIGIDVAAARAALAP